MRVSRLTDLFPRALQREFAQGRRLQEGQHLLEEADSRGAGETVALCDTLVDGVAAQVDLVVLRLLVDHRRAAGLRLLLDALLCLSRCEHPHVHQVRHDLVGDVGAGLHGVDNEFEGFFVLDLTSSLVVLRALGVVAEFRTQWHV